MLLSEDWLFDDVVVVNGLPVTVPNRSVTFEVRRSRSLVRAVQVIDMAAFDDLIDLEGLVADVARLTGRGGVRLLKSAISRASENVWSPQEVVMQFEWEGSGYDGLLCNAPVFDRFGVDTSTVALRRALDDDARAR